MILKLSDYRQDIVKPLTKGELHNLEKRIDELHNIIDCCIDSDYDIIESCENKLDWIIDILEGKTDYDTFQKNKQIS